MMVAVAPLAGKRTKNLIRMLWLIFSILTLLLKLAKHRDLSTPVDESYTSVRCFKKTYDFLQSITVSDISGTFNARSKTS